MTEAERLILTQPLGAVVGETPEIRSIYRIIQMAAKTNHPVLIVGEPGTGKEVIAKTIHALGPRSEMPFRVRSCVNIRGVDLERELLTPTAGISKLESGNSGTLFLDQIADLNLELQGVLLHALQRTESIRSADHPLHHPRIMAASNRDLHAAVSSGAFRRDLYFRLNALSLRVPPLRERRRDIPLLAEALLQELSRASGQHFRLSDSALQAILTYDWPGNVRELKSCLERACCTSTGPLLKLLDLPVEGSGKRDEIASGVPDVRVVPLSELERRSIEETLELVAGNKLRAAKLLGICRATLYRKLKDYGSQRRS